MRRISLLFAGIVLAVGLGAAPRYLISRTATSPDFVHFESAHVHPAVLTPSGGRLLVVNTPDGRLTVFDVTGAAPAKVAEIPVGMEPVSVACLDDSTAWVVNNLSDDVSIVNLNTLHTRATLRVGDEPNDVVFAGTPSRAYVSVTQEDVIKVYDPAALAAPVAVVPTAGRRPRALARNAAGTRVFAAIFEGGNRTTTIPAEKIPADSMPQDFGFPRDPGLPSPPPRVGLIVQQQPPANNWFDDLGNLWNSKVKYNMPDIDVVEINTSSNTVVRSFPGTGTTNFNLAVNPADNRVGVASTQSRDNLRFEPKLIGYLVQTEVCWINLTNAVVTVREVDKPAINYDIVPGTQAEADSALGIPTAIAYSSNGLVAYVTSLATNKLGVLNPSGTISTTVKARVPTLSGPTGVVVDDSRGRLYIVGRFRNELQTLSTTDFSEIGRTSLGFDPTPTGIVNGRRVFYGGFTSTHGDQACASCHIFADHDNIAWDLGDPFGGYVPPPNPNPAGLHGFDPMKGPLVTQSLRGLTNTEPLHWRGDRVDLAAFNGAFVSLMGRTAGLPDSQMTAFSDFVMPLAYPPNPYQYLDRTYPDAPIGEPSALRGQAYFNNTVFDSVGRKCVDCHSGVAGTNRQMLRYETIGQFQDLKVPQLRGLYRKTGFKDSVGAATKRGFGYAHDGSADKLTNFIGTNPLHRGTTVVADRRDLEAFALAFDTGLAPAVGHQLTFDGTNNTDPTAIATMDTLIGQAQLDNCELIAQGRVGGVQKSWLYEQVTGEWKGDRTADATITSAALHALADLGSEITVTGVPEGSGTRMAHDRDRDTYWDGDERDAMSNPGDPGSTPLNVGVEPGSRSTEGLRFVGPNPFRTSTDVHFALAKPGKVDVIVYDVLGREVKAVARGVWLTAGPQRVRWDGTTREDRSAAAGVYFVKLTTPGGHWTRAVVRIR